MADLPPLPELRFAEVSATSRLRYVGDRFCYMEAGRVDLPPVLLLHGIGANSLHWRYQLAGLADRFRLIAWNAPGYLLSDNLPAETPSCRDYADALDDLLAALGIDRFDIVANSFGTRVAQCFAYHRPGRIRRAVFTGTSIPHGMSPEERARSIEARGRMIRTWRLWFRGPSGGTARFGRHGRYFGFGTANSARDQSRRFHASSALWRRGRDAAARCGADNALADGSGRGRSRRAGGDECRTARCRSASRSSGHARRLRPPAGGGVSVARQ